MSDYIDKSNLYKSIVDREEEYRSALLKERNYNTATALQLQGLLNATTLIKHLVFDYPTVDAEPVKHGHWIYEPKDAIEMMFTLPKCSECEEESPNGGNYCPYCGAKMDKSKGETKEREEDG